MGAKGGRFEREFCVALSEWWAGEKDADIFWRSQGSGGRAKRRGRKGLQTAGSHGDIMATDASGAPFIELITIELKRGYSHKNVMDLIERKATGPQTQIEAWIQQAEESAENAGSFSWMLVIRRDQREAIVLMPQPLVKEFQAKGCFWDKPHPFATFVFEMRHFATNSKKRIICTSRRRLSIMTLTQWLKCVSPKVVKQLARELV